MIRNRLPIIVCLCVASGVARADDPSSYTVDGPLAEPLSIKVRVVNAMRGDRAGTRNEHVWLRETADALLEVKQPIARPRLQVFAPVGQGRRVTVDLVGPVGDGAARNVDLGVRDARLLPGRYEIRVGYLYKEGPPIDSVVVLGAMDTKYDPFFAVDGLEAKTDVKAREVTRVFPFIKALMLTDAERSGLFEKAPKELFVFPLFDLSEKLGPTYRAGGVYPRAGEPLLFLGFENSRPQVLSADGLVFSVNVKDLGPSLSTALALPERPRADKLSMATLVKLSGGPETEEGKVAAMVEKHEIAHAVCRERVLNPVQDWLGRDNTAWSQAKEDRHARIIEDAEKKADRECGGPEQKKIDALVKGAQERHDKRRLEGLTAARVRLGELFK